MKTIWKCGCKTEHKIEAGVKGYTCSFCGQPRNGEAPTPPQKETASQADTEPKTEAEVSGAKAPSLTPPGPPTSAGALSPIEHATAEAQEN